LAAAGAGLLERPAKPTTRAWSRYLDPSSAAVGYVGAVAVNLALAASSKKLRSRDQLLQGPAQERSIVRSRTVLCPRRLGRDAILFDYDFNALSRENIREGGNFEFVIPAKARWSSPMIVGLVKNAPDKDRRRR